MYSNSFGIGIRCHKKKFLDNNEGNSGAMSSRTKEILCLFLNASPLPWNVDLNEIFEMEQQTSTLSITQL